MDQGSLTKRLQARCKLFSVAGVGQAWDSPQPDEAVLLGLRPYQSALLREVRLCCANQPVVFAHSVLPKRSLRGTWHRLGVLGNRPLGAALFADPRVVRAPMAYRKLSRTHALYRRATSQMQDKPACLWARRSVFMRRGAAILVTEVFLPGVLGL
jgi:chorismate--pyruvate lyase